MSNPNGELKTSSELSLLSEEKLDETDQMEDERWGSTVGAPPRSPPIQSQLVQNIGTPSKIPASPSTRPHLVMQSPARVMASPNIMSPTAATFELEDSDPPDEKYLQELRGLPAERVAAKINDLVRIHLQLLIEEGKEIQKGKMLNILNPGTTTTTTTNGGPIASPKPT